MNNKAKSEKKTKLIDEALDWAKDLVVHLIVAVLICTFVCRPVIVNGDSMTNTLHDKDFLVMWSLLYQPKNGDIIAANCEGLNEVIIKRIIASEGQTVDIDFSTGKVFVDGIELDEPYIRNLTIDDEGAFDYPIVVPKGKYFAMGDNRQGSTDSRHPFVRFIDREDILGKAVFRVFHFDDIGTLK